MAGFVPVLGPMRLLGSGEPWEDLCSFFERVVTGAPARIRCTALPPGNWRPNRFTQPQGLFSAPFHWVNSAYISRSHPCQLSHFRGMKKDPNSSSEPQSCPPERDSGSRLYRELEMRGCGGRGGEVGEGNGQSSVIQEGQECRPLVTLGRRTNLAGAQISVWKLPHQRLCSLSSAGNLTTQ